LTGAPEYPPGRAVPSIRDRWRGEWRQLARSKNSVLLVWQASPRWMLAGIAIALLQSAAAPLMLFVLKQIIDAVGAAHSAGAQQHTPDVMRLIALAAAIAIADGAIRALAAVVSEVQAHVVSQRIHELLLVKSTLLELAYYESNDYHDTFHRAQQDAPERVLHLATSLNQVVRTTATLGGMLVLLLFFDWLVILLVFAITVPVVFVRARHEREQHRSHERTTPLERRASYFRSLLTRIEPAKEIRLFDLGTFFIKRFQALQAAIATERLAIARRRAVVEIITQILPEITIFGCLALLAYRGIQGQVSFGGVIVYFWALQWMRSLLNETLGGLVSIYKDNLLLSSLHEFLDLEIRMSEAERPLPVPRPLQSGIAIEDLSFRYPGNATNALEGISLTIRPGEKVALVGENGSGKTTLAKLLCRLYDPQHGDIRLDGISLRSFQIAALRREISVVFQDYVCYELSAAENIALGDSANTMNERAIEAAAARMGVHNAIERLPRGYATQLGRRFEGGTELSIGEWQKIALARAFTRNSQILVLDEPTSALDAEAEYEIFDSFFRLAEGRTAILISHRLSTVRMAEKIYVLDRGRIVESGTHRELMSLAGKYARLFNLQAQPYR
jgi:ATP-binding cassette, subfamily B, bacterial